MKISMGAILDGLAGDFNFEVVGEIRYELAFSGIAYVRTGSPTPPGMVWLAVKDALRAAAALRTGLAGAGAVADSGDGLGGSDSALAAVGASASGGGAGSAALSDVLYEGRGGFVFTRDAAAAEIFAEAGCAVAIVRGNVSFTKLHDAVQRVFAKYDEWDAGLRRVLAESSDVQALVDAATGIFGNPLLLHDNNFTVLAMSAEYRDEAALMPLLDNRKLPFLMMSDKSSEAKGTVTDKIIAFRAGDMPSLSANLFRRGKFKYRLMLTGLTGSLRPVDGAFLEYLADYARLALGLVREDKHQDMTLPALMAGVFSGEITSREYIEMHLKGFGWSGSDEYVFYRVFADARERDGSELRFMTGRIAELFDGQCIFEHENGIAAVFNMTKFVGSEESLDTAMSGFLRDNNLVAGRSGIFSGFGEFPQYYKQAGIAYELGAGEDPYSHLHRFRDVVKPYLLNCCSNELPARMVCAPELMKLKEYDEEHKTNFYKTLSVFLRNDLHPVKTSKELFIARSTFIYRMERIQAITGSDFGKPDDKWYLLLSLELIDRESGRERK